jgi:hypothetical protein
LVGACGPVQMMPAIAAVEAARAQTARVVRPPVILTCAVYTLGPPMLAITKHALVTKTPMGKKEPQVKDRNDVCGTCNVWV